MKLWLLRPVKGDPLWKPWYDKAFGFVVKAETEEDARAVANANSGDEGRYENRSEAAWLSDKHSTCVELTADTSDGEPQLVIKDYASA